MIEAVPQSAKIRAKDMACQILWTAPSLNYYLRKMDECFKEEKVESRLFIAQSDKPTEDNLKIGFGSTYRYYKELLEIAESFQQEWKYYSSGGWLLKIYDKKKILFYIIPMKGCLEVSMTIRDNERNNLLKDDAFQIVHEQIKTAGKYPEGYALRFTVKSGVENDMIKGLIENIITYRK